MTEWWSGCISLKGWDVTENPNDADCYVLPPDISHLTNDQLRSLPYLKGNETKHVFFSICENPTRVVGIPAIIFRCDFNKHLLAQGDFGMVWGWGSDDHYSMYPIQEGFKYDVVFQGQESGLGLTTRAIDSVTKAGLNCKIKVVPMFYGTYESRGDKETTTRLKAEYLEGLHQSRLSLCPMSVEGVVRYRFYEALSMGRVPVLIGDACLLPLADRINYDNCSIRIAEKDVDKTGEILKEWLAGHPDNEILQMGLYGYNSFKRWIEDDRWEITWGELVKERLGL